MNRDLVDGMKVPSKTQFKTNGYWEGVPCLADPKQKTLPSFWSWNDLQSEITWQFCRLHSLEQVDH